MNRRGEDGYVLFYAVVVILVISVVTATCLSEALRNFKAQEASVRRTEALYAAEGAVERYIARLMGKTVEGAKSVSEDGFDKLTEIDWSADDKSVTVTAESDGVTVKAKLMLTTEDKEIESVAHKVITEVEFSEYEIGGGAP